MDNPYFILFIVIALGMALGSIKVFGLSLGTSGVLFIALVAGHFGLTIPQGVGTIGLALFVYCIGLGAGGRFFAALAHQGSKLAILSITVIVIATIIACLCGQIFGISGSMMAGIFAGACTSTPALAAAQEALTGLAQSNVSVGYGIAYPFGVAGVVMFVQLLPKLLKIDLNTESEKLAQAKPEPKITSQLVRISNENIIGDRLADSPILEGFNCRITRIVKEGRLNPISLEDTFTLNSEILIIGRDDDVHRLAALIGSAVENNYVLDVKREQRKVIVTSKKVAGKSIRHLKTLRNYGIVISRITRLGFTFIPTSDTVIERNDVLTVVGPHDKLVDFRKAAGHRSSALDQTDLFSLGIGLSLGILLGVMKFGIGDGSFSLGIAGGPLVFALILGHLGHIGPVVGYIPRPTRMLLQDLGLVFFLADAGIKGGEGFLATLADKGVILLIAGVLVTTLPLILGYIVSTKIFKMNILETLGGMCGGMTSTPALGAIAAKTDSQIPVVSYATAYPIALILMTVCAKVIIEFLATI